MPSPLLQDNDDPNIIDKVGWWFSNRSKQTEWLGFLKIIKVIELLYNCNFDVHFIYIFKPFQ